MENPEALDDQKVSVLLTVPASEADAVLLQRLHGLRRVAVPRVAKRGGRREAVSGALGVDRGELVGELLVAEAGDALVVLGVVGDLEQPAAQLVQLLHLLRGHPHQQRPE